MGSIEDAIPIKIGKYEIDWDALDENSDPFKIAKSSKTPLSLSPSSDSIKGSYGPTSGSPLLNLPNGSLDCKKELPKENKIKKAIINDSHISGATNDLSVCNINDTNSLNLNGDSIDNEDLRRLGLNDSFYGDLSKLKDDISYSINKMEDNKEVINKHLLMDATLNHSPNDSLNESTENEFYQCHSFMAEESINSNMFKENLNCVPENKLLDITMLPFSQNTFNKNKPDILQSFKKNTPYDIMDASICEQPQTDKDNIHISDVNSYQNEEFCDPSCFDFLQKISHGGDVNSELRDSIYLKFDPCYEKGASPDLALRKINLFLKRQSISPRRVNDSPTPVEKLGYQTPPQEPNSPAMFNTITKTRPKKRDVIADDSHVMNDVTKTPDVTDEVGDGSRDGAFDTVVKVPVHNLAAATFRRPNRSNPEPTGGDRAGKKDRAGTQSLDETVLLLRGTPPIAPSTTKMAPESGTNLNAFNTGTIVLNKRRGADGKQNLPEPLQACVGPNSLFMGPLDYPTESGGQGCDPDPPAVQPSDGLPRTNQQTTKPPPPDPIQSSAALLQWESKRLLFEREIAGLKNRCTTLEQHKGSADDRALAQALELLDAYKTLLLKDGPRFSQGSPPPAIAAHHVTSVDGAGPASPNPDEYRELLKEKNQLAEDVKGVEVAFADLHRRYEKLKLNLENYKSNEEILRKSLVDREEKISAQLAIHDNYVTHVNSVLHEANGEIDKLKSDHKADNLTLQAKLKMLEMRTQSLERDLVEKVKENQQLTTMYNDLVSDMANK